MVTIYRRHRKDCPRRDDPAFRINVEGDLFLRKAQKHCTCPLWMDGFLEGQEVRRSLATRNWNTARDTVRAMMEPKESATAEARETLAGATDKFLADAEARKLNEATIYKYALLFRELRDFAARRGIKLLDEFGLDALSAFRSEWKLGPRTSLKKLERLRAFFGFAERRKWINGNPALELKAPKVSLCPTLPFTNEEMIRILAALDLYGKSAGVRNAQRLRAFVLVGRYSGMRIGDITQLSEDRIASNRLFLYTQKTGQPVYLVLPDFVVAALAAAPRSSARFYFWSGASKLHSAVGKWQRRLQRLFALAKVARGHCHRFRDTFSVGLLQSGVPIDRVSILLGHSSVRITERHYAAWTASRQEQIEADLRRAWGADPLAVLEAKGTKKVHGEMPRPN